MLYLILSARLAPCTLPSNPVLLLILSGRCVLMPGISRPRSDSFALVWSLLPQGSGLLVAAPDSARPLPSSLSLKGFWIVGLCVPS